MPALNLSADARLRYDEANGLIRSCFNPAFSGGQLPAGLTHFEIAAEFLAANSMLLGLDEIALVPDGEYDGSKGTTCRFAQYHGDTPVYRAWVNVTVGGPDRQVTSFVNRAEYGIPSAVAGGNGGITADEALEIVFLYPDMNFREGSHSSPKRYILRGRPAWQILADTAPPRRYLEFWIDAADGAVIEVNDRRRFATAPARVFMPDPVTSSRNPLLHWGSPASVLDRELTDVLLENLDETDGRVTGLSGRWVRILEREEPVLTEPVKGFRYLSKERRLGDVMVYHYLDRLAEWVYSLGVPAFNRAMAAPLDADAQGAGSADNSHFVVPVGGGPYIAFGEGGTPDATDPGVITHEFGHALHWYLLGPLPAAGACEEGFGDFLSCLFRDRFNRHGYDRANPFPWDNNQTVAWDPERRCDSKRKFDEPGFRRLGIYRRGSAWASALWEVYLETGGNAKDPEVRLLAAGELMTAYLDTLLAVGDAGPEEDLAVGLAGAGKGRLGEVVREVFAHRGLG